MIDKELIMEVLRNMRASCTDSSTYIEVDYNSANCTLEYRDLELVSMTVKRSE